MESSFRFTVNNIILRKLSFKLFLICMQTSFSSHHHHESIFEEVRAMKKGKHNDCVWTAQSHIIIPHQNFYLFLQGKELKRMESDVVRKWKLDSTHGEDAISLKLKCWGFSAVSPVWQQLKLLSSRNIHIKCDVHLKHVKSLLRSNS